MTDPYRRTLLACIAVTVLVVAPLAQTGVAVAGQAQPYHHHAADTEIDWYDYGPEPFRVAESEGKPVLLLVTAEWCHWCHEFSTRTLQNETVARYVNEHYVRVFLDYDAHRTVGNRYLGQGLPTVVVFAPDGNEIKRSSGFIPPAAFHDGLVELDTYLTTEYQSTGSSDTKRTPTTEPVAHGGDPNLERFTTEFDGMLQGRFDAGYGGFGTQPLKPSTPLLYYYLLRTHERDNDTVKLAMTRKTLTHMAAGNASRGLYDPVDGGFWHYAVQRDWRDPHYEKITWKNAVLTMNYLLLGEATGTQSYRDVGHHSLEFVVNDLQHESGGYYGSMVAAPSYYKLPPEDRRNRSKPPVDGVVYARSTAASVLLLLEAAELEGNETMRREAERSGTFLLRMVDENGTAYRYDPATRSYELNGTLRANAWTALALVELYHATGDEQYLEGARSVLSFSERRLAAPSGGYNELNTTSHQYRAGDQSSSARPAGLNGLMAWALLQTYEATGDERYRRQARTTMAVYEDAQFRLKQQQETAGMLVLTADRLEATSDSSLQTPPERSGGTPEGATPLFGFDSAQRLVQVGILTIFGGIVAVLLYYRRWGHAG